MRNILLAIAVAVLPASSAAAGPSSSHKADKPKPSGRLQPLKGAGHSNSCAVYGPGFVKVDGTDTCMKTGGGISIGAGSSWR